MPAKYSHVKRRTASGLFRKESNGVHVKEAHSNHSNHRESKLSPLVDRSISQALTAVAYLERDIARILLLRYEQDIARLFSTRLYSIALIHIPTLVMRCISLYGPSWLTHNYDCEDIKDFFRAAIGMDMRQAGERVATKSVLWSYTALRHFAISNNVSICSQRGLHTLHLLPFHNALQAHLSHLESAPPPSFSKPPHLGSLKGGQEALRNACELKFGLLGRGPASMAHWDSDWRDKVRVGYERLSHTLWDVAHDFDVRGYGLVLREKLINKWCDCGCSSDHLGEVCEKTVREDEHNERVRSGKQREWDGRGWGIHGWETEAEEDVWEVDLDFGAKSKGEDELTISEMMEWRYLKAEQEKEEGNIAFRKGDFYSAVKHYEAAHDYEPELPHYQLNLAAAHLKLENWMEAEKACTRALSQHRSSKGYFRRARARNMMNNTKDAIRDLRAVLEIQPQNIEALAELATLLPQERDNANHNHIPLEDSSSVDSTNGTSCNSSFDSELLSSSSSLIPKSNANRSRPNKSRSQSLPLPPWPRTKSDDRRLKIVWMPVGPSLYHGKGRWKDEGQGREKGEGQGKEGKKAKNGEKGRHRGEGKDEDLKAHKDDEGDGKRKFMEMKKIVYAGSLIYPTWERYSLKKCD